MLSEGESRATTRCLSSASSKQELMVESPLLFRLWPIALELRCSGFCRERLPLSAHTPVEPLTASRVLTGGPDTCKAIPFDLSAHHL